MIDAQGMLDAFVNNVIIVDPVDAPAVDARGAGGLRVLVAQLSFRDSLFLVVSRC
ncbi:MAG: hypothetical protein WKF78_13405 [Candidatus Limnocylindrales bacterium]